MITPKSGQLFLYSILGSIFNSVTVYILPAGIGNARCQIFQTQIQQNGGQTESSLLPGVTHVVVDDNMDSDRALRLLKVDCMPSGVQLVKCTWLSMCISEKQVVDITNYSLLCPKRFISNTMLIIAAPSHIYITFAAYSLELLNENCGEIETKVLYKTVQGGINLITIFGILFIKGISNAT